jgi:hypothetical protein
MTIQEFEKLLELETKIFFASWRKKHEEDPMRWPLEQEEEKWIEQLAASYLR